MADQELDTNDSSLHLSGERGILASRKRPFFTQEDTEASQDLLGRLKAFLPEIQKANQDLLAVGAGQERTASTLSEVALASTIRIDNQLLSFGGTLPENEETDAHTVESFAAEDEGPTIELNFAVGKTDDIPLISVLADDENDSEEESNNNQTLNASETIPLVSSLLQETRTKKTSREGPLISEL